MNKRFILLSFILFIFLLSCSKKPDFDMPDVNLANLTETKEIWLDYYNENIKLSSDFIALDDTLAIIKKTDFLKKLKTSRYLPIKLKSNTKLVYYKLQQVSPNKYRDITRGLLVDSYYAISNLEKEGKPFPKFEFTDLMGNLLSSENTKGKIVVLKAWFINCPPCLKEIPELNKFIEKYKDRDDVVFIGPANDSKEGLIKFLNRTEFNYQIIPDQNHFLSKSLGVTNFPTHYIIDKKGNISKVFNKASHLIDALESDFL